MATAIVEGARRVTGGVDTHGDLHVAAALDQIGGVLATATFAADSAGYRALIEWLCGFGPIAKVGVEGTGAYGAGLARHLAREGIDVVEVDRPNRQARRQQGKSDSLDAVEAARAALSGRATGRAKSRDGTIEAIRALLVAKRSATRMRTKSLTQMRHLVYSAPDQLSGALKGRSIRELVATAAALRPERSPEPVTAATKAALSSLAHRIQALDAELMRLGTLLSPLVEAAAPELLELLGVGVDTAASLLVAAGDNPQRLRSEAAWAHLCGVAPVPASSGKVTRHRLDRGGDRQANSALWRIVVVRITCDPNTKIYMERRLREGRSKREVIRILKRYVAREVYRHLPAG